MKKSGHHGAGGRRGGELFNLEKGLLESEPQKSVSRVKGVYSYLQPLRVEGGPRGLGLREGRLSR